MGIISYASRFGLTNAYELISVLKIAVLAVLYCNSNSLFYRI